MGKRRSRGDGNIEQLPSGQWRAALPGRKTAGRSKTFPTSTAARAWLRANADKPPPAPDTLSDWLDKWLVIQKGKVAASSYIADKSISKKHLRPALGAFRVAALTPLQLETYFASLKDTIASADLRHKIGKTLRTALNAAVRPGGLIASSPLVGVKIPPAPKPLTRALTPDELAAVLAAADALGWGAMFRLWVELGLRPGELYGLRWEDYDPVKGTVAVVRTVDAITHEYKPPKTPREAPIPLSVELVVEMEAERAGKVEGVMWPTKGRNTARGGLVWWKNNFRDFVWRKVLKRAGVKVGQQGRYVMRHTTCSLLLSEGASIVAVSKRLGHSTPAFTLKKYAHLLPTDQQKATDLIGKRLASLSPRISPQTP